MAATPDEEALHQLVRSVVDQLDADILVFSGELRRGRDTDLIDKVEQRTKRRKNVLLVLATYGGDPAAGYRMARTLQHSYEKFIAFVPGYCKSAGTLLVLGAHELIVTAHTELGPLDIQVPSKVETNEHGSVLTLGTGLLYVEARLKTVYKQYFDSLRRDVKLSTRLAAQTATLLVTRLYRPLMEQIDPMRLGEFDRANQIALSYGQRLIAKGGNFPESKLYELAMMYPSHDFVIDAHEAKGLFLHVREATSEEQLFSIARFMLLRNTEACSFWDVPDPPVPLPEKPEGKGPQDVEPGPARPPSRGRDSKAGNGGPTQRG